jgi:hypothetical protein
VRRWIVSVERAAFADEPEYYICRHSKPDCGNNAGLNGDGEFGAAGELCFDHGGGMHGFRDECVDGCVGNVHNSGDAVGKRDVCRGDAGIAEFFS